MKIYLNRIDGWDDAIISMFLSKRTLTRELECDIRKEDKNEGEKPVCGPAGLGDSKGINIVQVSFLCCCV